MKKYENLFKQILSVLSLLLISCFSYAQQTEYAPQQLTDQAQQWLSDEIASDDSVNIEIKVSPLDSRIGSKYCDKPLSFSLSQPSTQRQNTIIIHCASSDSWQLYLPVRIDEIVEAVILRQNIAAGTPITADMLETDSRERRFLRGALVSDAKLIIGAKNKRAMSMGQVVTLQDLCLVCKGDVVTISVSDNGLQVTSTGIAQSDGSLGDTISVVNRQSNRAISAEVVAVNQVSIKF